MTDPTNDPTTDPTTELPPPAADELREASAADGFMPPLDIPAGPEAPATTSQPPSRRQAIMRVAFILGVLGFVFLILLPAFGIDYQDVLEALLDLTWQQLLVMSLFGVAAWIASGAIFAALIRGLGLLRGTEAWLILTGIGASIPMGPWNMAVLWVVIRGWGMPAVETTGGIALYGIFDQLSRLALGAVAAFGLVVADRAGRDIDIESAAVWTWGILSALAFILASGVLIAIVRSERLATKVGDIGQRVTTAVLGRFKRFRVPDVRTATLHFRVTLGDTIRDRGLAAFVASMASKLAWSLVLTAGLRLVGIDDRVLPYAEILAVFAAVFIIMILPIAPGGAGVPEVLYISTFTALIGDQYASQITAGVMLFRAFQWFLPIPLAWILMARSRRGKPLLPTTAELRGRTSPQPETTLPNAAGSA